MTWYSMTTKWWDRNDSIQHVLIQYNKNNILPFRFTAQTAQIYQMSHFKFGRIEIKPENPIRKQILELKNYSNYFQNIHTFFIISKFPLIPPKYTPLTSPKKEKAATFWWLSLSIGEKAQREACLFSVLNDWDTFDICRRHLARQACSLFIIVGKLYNYKNYEIYWYFCKKKHLYYKNIKRKNVVQTWNRTWDRTCHSLSRPKMITNDRFPNHSRSNFNFSNLLWLMTGNQFYFILYCDPLHKPSSLTCLNIILCPMTENKWGIWNKVS